jgi:hypothetical protein
MRVMSDQRQRKPRPTLVTTIAPELMDALRVRASAAGAPIARVVDAALRAFLGTPDPIQVEPHDAA